MKNLLLLSVILISTINLLFAQTQQQEKKDTTTYYLSPIIVNPTQAKERETPVTFSNLNRKQIEERYTMQDIPAMLSDLPSMTTYSENGNGIGYNYINLRGFDQRRLSVMINGIPQNDPEDHNVYWIDFPDLLSSSSDIQVQRGAGSAFYGPPAIGGSINLITTPFTLKPGVKFESLIGFQEFGDSTAINTHKYETSVNSGLIDNKYMLYGKLSKITSGGYREQSEVDLSSYFLGAVRFDENTTTRFHFFGGPLTDALSYVGIPKKDNDDLNLRRKNYSYWDTTGGFYGVPQKEQAKEGFSQPHYELIHEWKIDSTKTLVNTIFYYTGEGYYDYDGDWIWYDSYATPWFQQHVGYDTAFGATKFPSMVLRGFVENHQWGWLPHIDMNLGSTKMTVGAELRFHRSKHWGSIPFASEYPSALFDPDFHFYDYNGAKDIVSGFVHAMYSANDKLSFMGDLQLVHNRYAIENEKFLGTSFDQNYLFLNPTFGINYNIDSQWNTYLSLAYTSREPRLKNLYSAEEAFYGAQPQFVQTNGSYDFANPLVKPEHLVDVELGAGYQDADVHATANLYWMEFADELVENGQIDLYGEPVTGNAKRTRHIGLEIDGMSKFNRELSVSSNISLSQNWFVDHTEYVKLHDSTGGTIIVPQSLVGNSLNGFPDVLWNLRVTYNYKGITSSLVAKYVGSFYTDNFENGENKNDEYTVINFEFLYRATKILGSDMAFHFEVRNLLNKLYIMNGQGNAFFPAAERNYLMGVTITL